MYESLETKPTWTYWSCLSFGWGVADFSSVLQLMELFPRCRYIIILIFLEELYQYYGTVVNTIVGNPKSWQTSYLYMKSSHVLSPCERAVSCQQDYEAQI
jgi:hypothetical protein